MLTIFGLLFVVYIAYLFFNRLGTGLPIIELMILIAGLQWILGAFLEYTSQNEFSKYRMYVSQRHYMSLIVPSFILFSSAALFWSKNFKRLHLNKNEINRVLPYGLKIYAIGAVSHMLKEFVPASLNFLFFTLSNLLFVGAIILFFGRGTKYQVACYSAFGYLVFLSLRSGFFHDLILWSSFFFMFWALKNRPSVRMKIVIFVSSIFFLVLLQSSKKIYRSVISSGAEVNYITILSDSFGEQVASGLFTDVSQLTNLNSRLNQGWIISAIMENMPSRVNFVKGESVLEAFKASILPRFLDRNKKMAGGQENFRRFTGLSLNDDTSMGVSLIGEFYANFGSYAIFAMGIWGMLIGKTWEKFMRYQSKHRLFLFFLPLIFLQVVKAETELVVILNHLVKTTLLVFFILFIARNFFKWKF